MLTHPNALSVDVATLTPAQRDGVACLVCAEEDGCMTPAGFVDGCQVFAHPHCLDGHTNGFVAVIGDTSTPEALDETRAFALDVADRLRFPVRVLVGMHHDVESYEGSVTLDSAFDDVASAVLATEAREADRMCLDFAAIASFSWDTQCGHCGEEDPTAQPRRFGNEWTTSVCDSCFAMSRAA
ncbi:hypothetical protein ABZO31_27690 [Streptomyces sp. HUAS MG47]|uniref:hypothetical protein n=1 Tax=Streptomyces solicamelliae TaxID=3231716 RepID=UPI003877D148